MNSVSIISIHVWIADEHGRCGTVLLALEQCKVEPNRNRCEFDLKHSLEELKTQHVFVFEQ